MDLTLLYRRVSLIWDQEESDRFSVDVWSSSGILSVPPPTRGGRQREEKEKATSSGRLEAPGWMQSGLKVEGSAPCSASQESARPKKARFLAAGFRVFQVLVGGKARSTEVVRTANEPTDPSGIC